MNIDSSHEQRGAGSVKNQICFICCLQETCLIGIDTHRLIAKVNLSSEWESQKAIARSLIAEKVALDKIRQKIKRPLYNKINTPPRISNNSRYLCTGYCDSKFHKQTLMNVKCLRASYTRIVDDFYIPFSFLDVTTWQINKETAELKVNIPCKRSIQIFLSSPWDLLSNIDHIIGFNASLKNKNQCNFLYLFGSRCNKIRN